MTILWDHDPGALETYAFALGSGVEQIQAGPRISRALGEDGSHTLVVIGPDIPLESACDLAEQERVDRPELGVILLRHRLDVNALAQALRSGVREVVQADDLPALADAVRRSEALTVQLAGHNPAAAGRDGKVITIFSAKGGVGKTTLSTNLAAYLASTGARTLLVDLDLMFGDVAISLQLTPHSSVRDVVAMSGHLDVQGIASVVTTHESSGLHVIAAPPDPADADRVPSHVVVELLRMARTAYDYVLVDTPPSFTEHVLAAFDLSDLTVLIATLDIPAIKNLRIAINTLDTLGEAKDARCIVLNRADTKVGLKPDDVESALKESIAASVPNSLSVPSSINRGVPIVLDDARGPVAVAIRELADIQIRQRFGETLPNGAKRSFGLLRSKR
ncbi:pilus assembly protein CpaE [Humibacillus xanthopallidus]|uniref:Pilus assembly protein CpaE n=1 Tax=Humibacillus xanthopallidus TaxID=412689 RepID=A0A543PMC9_9MICO|nr:AAA family ATPase [Humibacillus xanthopallidus]TQN45243.1 pilus assembly protein CpaE [Humibacillus xanthopallidus]